MEMKCINCVWNGDSEDTVGPLKHCPVCGDNTTETKIITKKIDTRKKTVKKGVAAKIKETVEDYLDDGKRNYSNNPNKKSPGRKKK